MSQAVRVCKWGRAEYEHGVQQPHLQGGPKGKEKKLKNLAEEEMSPTPTLSAPIFFFFSSYELFFFLYPIFLEPAQPLQTG